MREILFKAKSENIDGTFDWVEGYLSKCDGKWTICDDEGTGCFVEEETICQYTGLTDKNGKKIWEDDIVFVTDDNGCSGQIDTGIGDVIFLEGLWYIDGRVANSLYDINNCFQIEVIGNIFDNAELLEG